MMTGLLPRWSLRKAGFSRANTRCRLKIGLGRDTYGGGSSHLNAAHPYPRALRIQYHYPTFSVYTYIGFLVITKSIRLHKVVSFEKTRRNSK